MTMPRLAFGYLLTSLLLGASLAEAQSLCNPKGRRSLNSDVPTKITFVNTSGMYRALEWIDFNGGTKSYGGLNPGESKTINTFLTHPWLILDGPGDCQQIVMPRAGGSVVRLARTNAPSRGEEGGALKGCPPGTKPVPETDNCVPIKRRQPE